MVLAALPLFATAQTTKNVTVDAVGQLSKQIESSEKFKISELKVSGPLNAADVKFLQQIVNRSKANEKKGECVVTAVDISEAVFTEGKEAKATNKLPSGLFSGAKQLLKVTLPQGITNISKSCFDGCAALPNINIPESVTTIENQAFQGCESLTTISIPKNVTTIGNEAFENCKAITAVEIPDNVNDLGTQAFNGCTALTSVNIIGEVKKISSAAFKGCESLTSVSFPKDLKAIGNDAFRDCKSLESIELPEDVDEIGNSAFEDCSNLKAIEMAKVSKIGSNAFEDCKNLETVTLENISKLGSGVFKNCSSLSTVSLEGSLGDINANTFFGCTSLNSISIPAGVKSIGNSAFEGCRSLAEIDLPAALTKISDEAFADILDPCAESFETGETAPLVEKLHVYAMVSEAADWLAKAETNSLSRYVRPKILGSPSQKEQGQASFACELQVSLEALTSAFRRLDKAGHSPERPVSLARVSISVPERMKQLVEKLSASRSCQFRELVDTRIAYVVVTFLALLELIRLGRVYVEQSQPNGDICIHSRRVLGLAGRESQNDGRS